MRTREAACARDAECVGWIVVWYLGSAGSRGSQLATTGWPQLTQSALGSFLRSFGWATGYAAHIKLITDHTGHIAERCDIPT